MTPHSPSHGYILDDTLQFTIQFEASPRTLRPLELDAPAHRPDADLNPALNLVPHP